MNDTLRLYLRRSQIIDKKYEYSYGMHLENIPIE